MKGDERKKRSFVHLFHRTFWIRKRKRPQKNRRRRNEYPLSTSRLKKLIMSNETLTLTFFFPSFDPIKGKKVSEKLYKINLKTTKSFQLCFKKIKKKSWKIWTNIKQCRSRIWKLMITVVRETRFVRSWSNSKVFRRELLLCLKVASGETRVSLSLVIQ